MTVRAAVSKAPFARRLGLPTDAARGFYPMNMMLNSSPCTRRFALGTAFALAAATLLAADAKPEKKAEKKASAPVKAGLIQDDFPFQKACIGAKFPGKNDANKGIAIRLGTNAAMCFDQDLLRWSAGWTGGFISTKGVTFDGSHGGRVSECRRGEQGTRDERGGGLGAHSIVARR